MSSARRFLERGAFLALIGLTLTATAVAATTGWAIVSESARSSGADETLRIPPLAESTGDHGPRVFDLVDQAGRSEIVVAVDGERVRGSRNAWLGADECEEGANIQSLPTPQ